MCEHMLPHFFIEPHTKSTATLFRFGHLCCVVFNSSSSLPSPPLPSPPRVAQFVYCVLVGSFPFNSFLAGFSSTVGAFVLTGWLCVRVSAAAKGRIVAADGATYVGYVHGLCLGARRLHSSPREAIKCSSIAAFSSAGDRFPLPSFDVAAELSSQLRGPRSLSACGLDRWPALGNMRTLLS